MMKKNKPSVDGVSKAPGRRKIGDFDDSKPINMSKQVSAKENNKTVGFGREQKSGTKTHITDPIEGTRSPTDKSKMKVSKWKAKRKARKMARKQKDAQRKPWWRITRRIAIVGGLSMVLLGLVIGVQAWLAWQSVIDRDGDGAIALQEDIDPSQLNGEGDGRVNILLIGEGGPGHDDGSRISDSIIIASIDPFAKEVAMLSIPRDLRVPIPGYEETRINAAHAYGERYGFNEAGYPSDGIGLAQKTVEEVLDVNIHYYVRVNFKGWQRAVDAVGGIDIKLDEPVYDNNFDWQYGRDALRLPAGNVHLDGTQALLLARARGAGTASYGVTNDFDRTEHQRDMLLALKDKVFSVGTVANPQTLSSLISSVGNNLKTNLELPEMLRVYEILNEVSQDKILTYGLDNSEDNYLASANIGGASMLVPRSGNFNEIQKFVRSIFVDGFIKSEAASIDILNGTTELGLATKKSSELKSYGYNVLNVLNAPSKNYTDTIIYDLSDGKAPFTKRLLEQRFGVTMLPESQLPDSITTSSSFVIIVGADGT